MSRSKTLPALELRAGRAPVFNPAFPNSLSDFQSFVGGLIDVVNVEHETIRALDRVYSTRFGPRACVVVADEMFPETMPLNRVASMLAGQQVFGDALFVDLP